MIELLVVLGVIVLVSVVTLPLFLNYQKSAKLKNEAQLLVTNLRLAQQLAITKQVDHQIKLFPLTDSYQMINAQTSQIIRDITLDSEVSIDNVTGLTDDTVQFNAIGGALEVGSITFINTKNSTTTVQIKPSGYAQIIE